MRIACPRGVVAYDGRLVLLNRHLYLSPAWSDPSGRVLANPTNDLLGRPVLGSVVRRCDLGVQSRRERPGLGAVDGDLDEPNSLIVGA